jgi:hypothetical protein
VEWLKAAKADTQQAWAERQFQGDSLEQGALQNSFALGGVDFLEQVIDKIEAVAQEDSHG